VTGLAVDEHMHELIVRAGFISELRLSLSWKPGRAGGSKSLRHVRALFSSRGRQAQVATAANKASIVGKHIIDCLTCSILLTL
jgi:hypothetical protein